VRALGFRAGHSFAPRPWLAFGFAGSAAPSLSTLGRFAGETLASTLAAQTVLRVRIGRPLRGPCINLAYGRSLVRNSPRGWTPRSLTTIRWSGRRAVAWCWRRPRPPPERQGDAEAMAGTGLPIASRACVPVCLLACVLACLSTMLPRALARPRRTSRPGRVFGAHPRGEFRTSGAAVGHISTRVAQRPFRYATRRTV
jgi:hypothetical protein